MFCPTRIQCRIELDTEHPCYCKVFITNKDKLPKRFTKLLKSSGEITPSKYKEFCFKIFDSIIAMKRHYGKKIFFDFNFSILVSFCLSLSLPISRLLFLYIYIFVKYQTIRKTCQSYFP